MSLGTASDPGRVKYRCWLVPEHGTAALVGPACQSTVAANASGLDTVIVEEHPEVGSPVQCTGLVHPRVVDMASASETVINTITGLKLFFPGGRMLEIPTDEPKAMVIDRRRFDELLSSRAVDRGARLMTGHRFKGFERIPGGLKVTLEGPEGLACVETPLLVGADGCRSSVAREAGLGPCMEVVRGIQVELDVRLEDQEGRGIPWQQSCPRVLRLGAALRRYRPLALAYRTVMALPADISALLKRRPG